MSDESDDSESEPWYYKPVAQTNEASGKPLARETKESISSAFQKSQQDSEATWNKCLQLLIPAKLLTNAVFLGSGKSMGNIMTNPWAIWMCTRPSGERSCTLTTLQALISFGKEYDENLFESKKKLISSQTTDSSTIDLQYCTRTKNLEKYVVK